VRPEWSPAATAKADLFLQDAIARIGRLPDVEAVGATALLPASGMGWGKVLTLYDRPLAASVEQLPPFEYRVVAGDYFRAAGIRLVRGRLFTDVDTARSAPVAIVNEEFVRRFQNGRNPIGAPLSVNPPRRLLPAVAVSSDTPDEPIRFAIVGVVSDARNVSVNQPADPMVYCPYAQGAEGTLTMSFVVRTRPDPLAVAPAIRRELSAIDKNLPLANITTMTQALSAALGRPEMEMYMLVAFGGIALVVAAVGVYGLIAFIVAQRTREIGVRLALGAPRAGIQREVLRQGLTLAVVGTGLGVVGAIALGRAMRSMIFGVSGTDPWVFTAIIALLLVTAAAASLVPARRAARTDPIAALRDGL
jgi:predicted permease